MTFYLTVSRTSCIYFVTLEDFFNLSKRFENQPVKHNQEEVESVHYIKVYSKEVLKQYCLCRNFRRELTLAIAFKAIDSAERLGSKTHSRYFSFVYYLISVPLYTMFNALASENLGLVPNKTLVIYYQLTSYINFLSSCFSVSVTFLCWKTMEVSLA